MKWEEFVCEGVCACLRDAASRHVQLRDVRTSLGDVLGSIVCYLCVLQYDIQYHLMRDKFCIWDNVSPNTVFGCIQY